MTLRTRRTIFYVLFALFFMIGGGVVLYAEGWRIDLGGHVEKVGAIFVRSFPADAAITLDKINIPNGTNFLSEGTLISNLFPRTYTVTLKQDGFMDWHENATVLPSLVTEYKYAVLIPKMSTDTASGTVTDFAVASNEMVLAHGDGSITWRGTKIGNGTMVSTSANPRDVVFRTDAGTYLLYDFESGSTTDLSAILAKSGIPSQYISTIQLDPYDPTTVVVATPGHVVSINAVTDALTTIGRAPGEAIINPAIAISPSSIAWTRFTNASGTSIVIYDKFSGAVATSTATATSRTAELAWLNSNTLGVLQGDGELFVYDVPSRNLQKLADDVSAFHATADGSIVAALEHKSLEIFPFTNATTYHRFNIPDIQNARDISWYKDMNHLFITYDDHVAFLDLDDLGLNNLTTVTPIAKNSKTSYDPQANALYFISPTGTLARLDFPN